MSASMRITRQSRSNIKVIASPRATVVLPSPGLALVMRTVRGSLVGCAGMERIRDSMCRLMARNSSRVRDSSKCGVTHRAYTLDLAGAGDEWLAAMGRLGAIRALGVVGRKKRERQFHEIVHGTPPTERLRKGSSCRTPRRSRRSSSPRKRAARVSRRACSTSGNSQDTVPTTGSCKLFSTSRGET